MTDFKGEEMNTRQHFINARLKKDYTQEELLFQYHLRYDENLTLRTLQRIEYGERCHQVTALRLCKILDLDPFEVWNIG